MKTSDYRIPSDDSGITDRYSGIIRMLGRPIEKPLYLLFLIFLFYALFDLASTFIQWGEIDNWITPLFHFTMGYLLIAGYFKLVLPEFFLRRRRIRAVFYFLVMLSALVLMKLLVFNLFSDGLTLSKAFLVNEFNRVFHFLIITSVVWTLYDNLRVRQLNTEVEMKHEQLQMLHRSMQLSPHFVVNSLSVYTARIIKLSPALTTEFSFLTSLLRYSFKEFGLPNFLKEEVNAVNYYLEIQKMRFPRLSLEVEVQVGDVAKNLPMPKLCLLTLVENVFFHGDYTDADHPCVLKFLLTPDDSTEGWVLEVAIFNKILDREVKVRSGFGASSVFRVLDYQFGNRFEYTVESDGFNYSLLLTIHYGAEVQNWTD